MRSRNSVRFGQLGERVVHGGVPELLLELDDPPQVGLEPAAVQRGRHVPGERLQQGEVAAAERADVAEPAGHQEQALHPALRAQHRHHGVLERVPGGVALQLGTAGGAGPGGGHARLAGPGDEPVGVLPVLQRPQGDGVLALAAAAQRRERVVVLAEQDELGIRGPEGAADGGQEVGQRGGGVVAGVEQRRHLVQQAEVVLLLAGLGVGAVGGDEQHRRQGQQDQRRRVLHGDLGGEQPERGHRERERHRQAEHARQRPQAQVALRQADRGEDAQAGRERADGDGGQAGDPVPGARQGACPATRTAKRVVARQPLRAYWARLKASLRPNWRRCSTRASPAPATCAVISAAGSTRYSPATSTRSVREKECESRCSWMCTTSSSPAAKAATHTGQGRVSGPRRTAGGPRTTATYSAAAAAATTATSRPMRRLVDSHGRASRQQLPAASPTSRSPPVVHRLSVPDRSASTGRSCRRSRDLFGCCGQLSPGGARSGPGVAAEPRPAGGRREGQHRPAAQPGRQTRGRRRANSPRGRCCVVVVAGHCAPRCSGTGPSITEGSDNSAPADLWIRWTPALSRPGTPRSRAPARPPR